jgi:hypothetical protein
MSEKERETEGQQKTDPAQVINAVLDAAYNMQPASPVLQFQLEQALDKNGIIILQAPTDGNISDPGTTVETPKKPS